jgi:hypothetical protein
MGSRGGLGGDVVTTWEMCSDFDVVTSFVSSSSLTIVIRNQVAARRNTVSLSLHLESP